MQLLSVAIAVVATITGTLAARSLGVETGPVIIAVAAGIFAIALVARREK